MREFSALFVSDYLVSSFFLLPLLGLYLALSLKKVALGTIIRFHKSLILLSIILPACMILMAYAGNLETELFKWNENSQAPIPAESPTSESAFGGTGHPSFENQTAGGLPRIQDIIFYFMDLVMLFSVLGLLIFALRYTLQVWRMGKIREDSVVSKLDMNCHLIESPRIMSPFSVGYVYKTIFIPTGISALEKKLIIQHELNHFRCQHHLWTLLEALLSCVFWFNPFAHILRRRGAFLRELECDRQTTEKSDKYEYTRLLVKTAETIARTNTDRRFSLLTQGWARKGELKRRIENLMGKKSAKKKTVISILIIVAIIATAGITLLFGDLNDATKKEILSEIERNYIQRAPLATRIDIEKVPRYFIDALLVQEDSRFYEHKGVDKKSIFRAAGSNLKSFLSGGPLYKHGGSTITQQLAKQFTNHPIRTFKRKFEELKIARVLEMSFTKDEILEMYLNMIYFGNGANGLKAASSKYFGHEYRSLTLNESAMLIPFITAPEKYNLIKNPDTARKRQEYLLKRIATAKLDSV